MKSIYDVDNRYSAEAFELERKLLLTVQPLFSLYLARGYNPREVAQVMEETIRTEMCLQLMGFKGPGLDKKRVNPRKAGAVPMLVNPTSGTPLTQIGQYWKSVHLANFCAPREFLS